MIRAALITPISGPLASYGRAGAIALDLWRQWCPDEIDLTVLDAHPDPVAALRQAERSQLDLLFGPYGSGPAAAVARSTPRLLWNHGGARVEAAENVVNVLAPADTYFVGALQAVHRAEPRGSRVCIMHTDSGFGRAVADGAKREAKQLGMSTISRPILRDPADAEILLVSGGFTDEVTVAEKLLPGGWRAAGFVGAGVEEVLAGLGQLREGLLGPAQWLPSAAPLPDEGPPATEFVTTYQRVAGTTPPYPAAQAFASGLIAARCLRETRTTDDAALRQAAHSLDCTTMFARFKLHPRTRRQIGHRVLTVQWQDGVRRVIWPPEQAQAAFRYPLPASRPPG
ncbi:MAG: ABC transporter substrate-binding protein [Actinophytocola sp.]|nr:ABC transporter substrate-binding protein [Actinophytocola sp.]